MVWTAAAIKGLCWTRIVPSSYWRGREVIHAVSERRVPEAADLAEAYRQACGARPALP